MPDLEKVNEWTNQRTLFVASKDVNMSQAWDTLQSLLYKNDFNRIHTIRRKQALTGGLTNQAVSQSLSFHLFLMKRWTSFPALSMSNFCSSVAGSETIIVSFVIPHSANAGRQEGRFEGDGGGKSFPVKPQSPSWSIRAWMDGSTKSGW